MHPKLYQVCIYFRGIFLKVIAFDSQKKIRAFLRQEGVSFSNDTLCSLDASDDPLTIAKGEMLYEVAIPLGCLNDVYCEDGRIYKALSLYAREHRMPYRKAYYLCSHHKLDFIRREERIYVKETDK